MPQEAIVSLSAPLSLFSYLWFILSVYSSALISDYLISHDQELMLCGTEQPLFGYKAVISYRLALPRQKPKGNIFLLFVSSLVPSG